MTITVGNSNRTTIHQHSQRMTIGFLALLFLTVMVIPNTCSAFSPESYPSGEIHYGQPDLEPEHQATHSESHQQQQQHSTQPLTPLSLIHSLLSAGGVTASTAPQGRSILSALASLLPLLLSPRDETNPLPINIPELLRMVGVDSNKIGTMVINAIVYVIELVSNHFFGGSNSIDGRKIDSPTAFVLGLFDTRKAEKFLKIISNPDYPTNIISSLKKATGNDTVCIQQLICKMSPLWWSVNRSVRDLAPIALGKASASSPLMKMGWKSLFMKYVPSVKEFTDNSNLCEARYTGCVVAAFGTQQQNSQKQQQSIYH